MWAFSTGYLATFQQTSFQKYLHDLKYESGKDDNDYKVTNGSVIVMHMLENAKYTAQVFGHYDSCLEKRGATALPGLTSIRRLIPGKEQKKAIKKR
jgi:hypothetical protein